MERDKQIKSILELNNRIIRTKSNDPNNYFKIKFNRYKLAKIISNTLTNPSLSEINYISGPSTPEI